MRAARAETAAETVRAAGAEAFAGTARAMRAETVAGTARAKFIARAVRAELAARGKPIAETVRASRATSPPAAHRRNKAAAPFSRERHAAGAAQFIDRTMSAAVRADDPIFFLHKHMFHSSFHSLILFCT
ncbi:MAG: hypothetical protein IKO07_09980 [Clostridia bacterium]|nr:hypothetical protein [Clostridia bacterium]